MTRTIITIALLLAAVCAFAAEEAAPVFPVDVLEGEKGPYLMGPMTREAWLDFEPTLNDEYHDYLPADDQVRALSYLEQDITITCVLGTWCGDSRREVPRFWKLLDEIALPGLELVMVGVGRTDAPEALAWQADHGVTPGYRERFGIEYVPTFIVSVDGEELGRIIETPTVSLEADLAEILGVRPTPAWH